MEAREQRGMAIKSKRLLPEHHDSPLGFEGRETPVVVDLHQGGFLAEDRSRDGVRLCARRGEVNIQYGQTRRSHCEDHRRRVFHAIPLEHPALISSTGGAQRPGHSMMNTLMRVVFPLRSATLYAFNVYTYLPQRLFYYQILVLLYEILWAKYCRLRIRSIAYRALARTPDSARHGCKRSRCHQSVFKSTVKTAEVSVWLKRVYCTEAPNADEGYRRTADSTLHPPFVSTVSPIPQAQNSVKFGDVEILVNIE